MTGDADVIVDDDTVFPGQRASGTDREPVSMSRSPVDARIVIGASLDSHLQLRRGAV
jgi:hypothetical protein